MGRTTRPKQKRGEIPNKDTFTRINFLYQAAYSALKQNPGNTELIRFYCHCVKNVAEKQVLRLHPYMKRQICKKCAMLLIPGVTSTMRKKGRTQQHMVVKCLECGTPRRFPTDPSYKLWCEQPEAWAAMYSGGVLTNQTPDQRASGKSGEAARDGTRAHGNDFGKTGVETCSSSNATSFPVTNATTDREFNTEMINSRQNEDGNLTSPVIHMKPNPNISEKHDSVGDVKPLKSDDNGITMNKGEFFISANFLCPLNPCDTHKSVISSSSNSFECKHNRCRYRPKCRKMSHKELETDLRLLYHETKGPLEHSCGREEMERVSTHTAPSSQV